jgi:hypothetical protein
MRDLIALCQKTAVDSMEHFLVVLSFVPEDKLNWAPSPNAKNALQIAAHTAVTAGNFAKMIRDRQLPQDVVAHLDRTNKAEAALTTLPDIEAEFRRNTAEVVEALGTLTDEEVAMRLDSGQGWPAPMTFLMNLPTLHATGHTYQLDYLQTCWGDLEVHF